MLTTLIDTETLAQHLSDPSFVIVDCRFKVDDIAWGARVHAEQSIPGAAFADIEYDLSGPKTGSNGRHPLPDPTVLAETFTSLGIERGKQIVAFDQDAGMYASRLWWLLRWMGDDAVAVLDGGFARWMAEGRPVAPGKKAVPARVKFTGTADRSMIVETEEIARLVGDPKWRLLDARAPERYRGEIEPIDPVAGHIPTAVNHPFKSNVDNEGKFLPVETLRESLARSTGGVPPERVVCYCGSGVTAAQDILVFEHVGLKGVRLYPGSWSEWVSDSRRPTAKGEE